MLYSIIFFLNIIFLTSFVSAEVPSYIPICGRRNPNLNECVKNSVDTLRPKLRDGIPELDVPSTNPLFMEEGLPLADSPDFKAGAKNVKIFNALDFEVKRLNVDLENKKIDIDIFFKKMKLQGDYHVKAKIVVPVEGSGPIDIDAEDIESNSTMIFKIINTKKGKQLFFTSMKCKLRIRDYKSTFVAKAGANDQFADAINAVINTNRVEIIESLTPSLEKAIASKLLELSNRICKNFTYDELFPDRE
ncbi:putative beta-carotene-binding protein [Microplitis mediator]|uniref:putative beta-carotene-binding protein n=1 Tax=Microplitis mediator TaxID=375433 RepID=UPI002556719B|nr:putative beta-carotene-binding protein [Microplitis mediator]